MKSQPEQVTVDVDELDRQAWNLPVPAKPPKASQAPFSDAVRTRGQDRA
jgi:hypothetical protein